MNRSSGAELNIERPANVHDVTAHIVGKTGNVPTMKLQKLQSCCNGWF